MKANQQYVRVALRPCVDINKLAEKIIICGPAGSSILRQVLDGKNGVAEIPLETIRLATGTQEELEIIFDNFELMEPRTLTPLFTALIRDRCGE